MVTVTPHGPHTHSHATNRWREFFDWQVGGPVIVGYGACQKVTDGSACVCVFVCRPLEAPINISLMVYVLPVGIDPCFYFPISSHLWLVRVVWHSYMHKHTFPEPMFVCAFGG